MSIKQKSKASVSVLYMVELAVLLALVIVLQLWGSQIKIGATSISLVLIPIVLGGMLTGPVGGAILGFAFGAMTLIAGIVGTDPFTAILYSERPVATVLICLGKATAAGLGAALIFHFMKKKHPYLGTFLAAAAAPILNTGIFILGCLFISDTLKANFLSDGTSVMYFLIIICAGFNFLLEFFVNLVCAPAIYRVICAVGNKTKKDYQ